MAAGQVIRLNNKLKVVQGYAPTSSYDDQIVERFYEDVESAMAKVKTLRLMADMTRRIN